MTTPMRWFREPSEAREPAMRRLAHKAHQPLALLGFAMAACGGATPSPAPPGAPSGDAGAVVVREDTRRETNASPVRSLFEPEPTARVIELREGRASYYSDRLAGRSTASGEPYDPRALTAASRDLPFGTRVRVHRLDAEGRSIAWVVVRVNDRGPFRDHSRILDLSRAAAERLDMIQSGVVSIRAEILGD